MKRIIWVLIVWLACLPIMVGCGQTEQQKKITELIKQLNAFSWEEREKATWSLSRIGEPALPFLRKAAKDDCQESETGWRARDIIDIIERKPKTPADIDRIFDDCVNEKFYEPEGVRAVSGWIKELPSGNKVHRATLQQQADPIIAYGPKAVPHLFKWVRNKRWHVSYIATYSLQEITGLKGHPSPFDEESRANPTEHAVKIWQKWWEENKDKAE